MAPTSFFHKPELALRRAIELQGIQQEDAALTLLHEVLSSRRHRTWSPIYEQIMICYLDLCLEHHRSREAKDGLHQYRNLSQTQAPGSLEKVILYLINKAEASCTEAKAYVDAQQLASDNAAAAAAAAAETAAAAAAATAASSSVPDIEEDDSPGGDENPEGNGEDSGADGGSGFGGGASPEAILLSTMSTDPAKSQRDSALLLPALKFLWETYRAVLDILRSNSKLEHVYHAAAQGALRFCRVYHRRMEFRHLCDMLRMHLGNLRQFGATSLDDVDGTSATGKTSNKVRGWEGWTSDSIELYLQTRFAQLETASVLHRYMEGFRTVEDIYNILQISHARRKANPDAPAPKAKLMAAYYEKLTTLFWVSENYLFHGFAWYKFYTLCKEYNKVMSDEMKNLQASAVLLAALCIPQVPTGTGVGDASMNQKSKQQQQNNSHGIRSTMEDDIVKQKMARMATLLGFHTRNPTREALLTEIRSKNILEQVPQYLRDLYFLLEETSDPLIMVGQARPLLEQLKNQDRQVHMESSNFEETKEDPAGYDESTTSLGRYVKPLTAVLLQKLIVNLAASYHTVSLDHLKKLTSGLEAFDLTFEQVEKAIVQFTLQATKSGTALSVRIDHRANCLRFGEANLESELMRSQLTVLYKQLMKVSRILEVPDASINKARLETRMQRLLMIRSALPAEHRSILDRKNYIEECKEKAERMAQEKIKDELRTKAEEELARKLEEEKRIAREQKMREQEKQKRIQMELENQEKKRFLVSMGKYKEGITEEQIAKIDTEALQKEHQEKLIKEKEEAERKLKEAAKKLDYLVRAIRIEELPLIKKQYEEKTNMDREEYEQEVKAKAEQAKIQWEADVKDKSLLEKHSVFEHFGTFEEYIMKGRRMKHEQLCREADENALVEAEKAKLRRARRRKDEEAKRIADEIKRKQKEEEERIRKEEEAIKKKAAEEAKRIQQEKDAAEAAAAAARAAEEESSSAAPVTATPTAASSTTTPAPRSLASLSSSSGGGTGGKYVPPSLRGAAGSSGGGDGDRGGSRGAYNNSRPGSRFGSGGGGPGGVGSSSGGGGSYPGGGRYEGRRTTESSSSAGGGGGGSGGGERPRFINSSVGRGGGVGGSDENKRSNEQQPRENSRWNNK